MYSEDILQNLHSQKYLWANWLVTENMIMSFLQMKYVNQFQ